MNPHEADDKHLAFGLFHVNEARLWLHKIKDRSLNLRDMTLLFAMMSLANTKTGMIRFTIKELASDLGVNPTSLSASLSRLKKQCIVATLKGDHGDRYYMINPYLFSVGTRKNWGFMLKRFKSAFDAETANAIDEGPGAIC
jgi:hypothetical protein